MLYLSCSRLLPFRNPTVDTGAAILSSGIKLAAGKSITRPVVLRPSFHSQKCAEGPHIYKKDGWYYLLVAEGGNVLDHQVRMARSKTPLGPYEEPPQGMNPFLFNGMNSEVQSTGHADLVMDAHGYWWAFFLAIRPQSNGSTPLGRESWFVPVEWKKDEWPVFNSRGPVELSVSTALLPAQRHFTGWRDEFTGGEIQSANDCIRR